MKNNLASMAVCTVLTLIVSLTTHWFIGLAVIFVIIAWSTPPLWIAFSIGFTSAFLAWAGTATYLSAANQHLLADQIGQLFGGISTALLLILTGLVGGLAGGLIAGSATLIFGRKEGKIGL